MSHHQTNTLIVVQVHRGRAEGGGTSVLLDGRLGPATERIPVRIRVVVVVVRVPQREGAELSGTAHDRTPLAVAGVDAWEVKQKDILKKK